MLRLGDNFQKAGADVMEHSPRRASAFEPDDSKQNLRLVGDVPTKEAPKCFPKETPTKEAPKQEEEELGEEMI